MSANQLRGEVDLTLDGQTFVLRPSYSAIVEAEKGTGKSLVELATAAGDGKLSLSDTAIVVTEMIKAYGKAHEDVALMGSNPMRIGQLIQEFGLMQVQLRLVMVLTMAATGGCKADGTPKNDEGDDQGEAMATGTSQILAADLVASQQQPSAGRQKPSGKPRRTSSGARTKSGKK